MSDSISMNPTNEIRRQDPAQTGAPAALDVEHLFRYHPPTEQQALQYEAIRAAAKQFALVLLANTPRSADQSAAIRHLRECVMTANAAIALEGPS